MKDELHKRTSLLDALKGMEVETTGKAEIAEDSTSPFKDEISEPLIQRGDKSAKRVEKGLLALLSPPHFEVLRNYDPSLKRGRNDYVKDIPRQETPWLDLLKHMDAGAISEAENGLDVASSSED